MKQAKWKGQNTCTLLSAPWDKIFICPLRLNRFDIRNISNLQGVHQCLVALLISMSPTTNIITNINIDDQCKIPNLKYQGKIRSTRLCHENIKVVVITLTGGAKTNRTRKKEIDHTCYPAFAYKYVYFLLSVCIYCDRICIICDHICIYCKHTGCFFNWYPP